jgi:hypothetical protein
VGAYFAALVDVAELRDDRPDTHHHQRKPLPPVHNAHKRWRAEPSAIAIDLAVLQTTEHRRSRAENEMNYRV